jgi:purine-cytosine permease-like protein
VKESKRFWLTWPAVLIFMPFILFSLALLVGLAGFFPHPVALGAVAPGVRSWALKTFCLWVGTAVVLWVAFGIIRERGNLD